MKRHDAVDEVHFAKLEAPYIDERAGVGAAGGGWPGPEQGVASVGGRVTDKLAISSG